MSDDFYEFMGLDRDCSKADVKRRYRELVKSMHPDIGGDPAQFVKLTEIYNTLIDDDERAFYDANGEARQQNAINFQKSVMKTLAQLYQDTIEAAINQGVDVDSLYVVKQMRQFANETVRRMSDDHTKNRRLLMTFQKLEGRIKRNDEEENKFSEINKAAIAALKEVDTGLDAELRIVERVVEILDEYEDVEEMIRFAQASRWPFEPARGNFWKDVFGDITTT